ncbi:hypothetical protein F2Q70_00044097 [Brassica cretica]|uniref:Uncharacterized protein n=1 Tax=Brassica cretica TaxID=69181 RepID=A0A8S9KGY4_BRACR|nr:hypothetical protein F2Q70_00044097 [Brassica cretica]
MVLGGSKTLIKCWYLNGRGRVDESIDFDRHYGRLVEMLNQKREHNISGDYLHGWSICVMLTFDPLEPNSSMCRTSDPVKADYGMDIFADEICKTSILDLSTNIAIYITRELCDVVLRDVPEILKGLGFVGLTNLYNGMDNVKNPVVNLLGRDNGICVVGTHDVYDHTHINDVAYM